MAKTIVYPLKTDEMKAAPTVTNNPQQAAEKKKNKQRQSATAPTFVREIEIANAQTQKPGAAKGNTNKAGSNADAAHSGIPAVHGTQSAYSGGSELMYAQFQTSLSRTGNQANADTQKKEMDYKMTLNIAELRDYHDNKPAASQQPAAAATAPEAAKTTADPKKASPAAPQTEKPAAPQDAIDATPKTAAANPAFAGMATQIGTTAKAQKQHEAAAKSSHDAQEAAPSPANERESQAQSGQVDHMDAQKPGKFSADDFRKQLKQKIEGMTLPTDEKEADDFENHNNIKEVNSNAMSDVAAEKNAATGDIAAATSRKPDTANQPVRPVTPLHEPAHGKAPAVVNAKKAMPLKRDAAAIEEPVKAQTNELDDRMKENGVTDNMLAKSNEPSFIDALDQKKNAKEQSKAATAQFRQDEGGKLTETRTDAQQAAATEIGGMFAGRTTGLNKAHKNQKETSDKDSKARKEVADRVNGIFTKTQTDVNNILKNLDTTVARLFDEGSNASKAAFEKHVKDNMRAYKKKRYGDAAKSYGALAAAGLWLWDKATGLPDEVNEFFVSGKQRYIDTMDIHIIKISNLVANELNAAKARIATGRKEVKQYIDGLSPALRKLGKDAITAIQGKFSELEETVNAKKDALIDTLAKKYADNVAAIDKRIEDLKAANSGFINQALGALAGVFAFIIDMKNKLMSLLGKIGDVVMAIITDPIGFFSNLIAGVGQGFTNFSNNIWTHLKTGFFGWLTGSMKGITLTMPDDVFSIKGIFSIVMQVLGIGWAGIRSIGVTVLGEPVVKGLEETVKIVGIVQKDGIAGLWDYLKDQFQDLKATVMDTIMDMLQTQVIQAGIKWILGLLSPVGAFVKAITMIVDVVKFFVQRAAQIMDLVNAFIDSVSAIASGKVGAVAKSIENALARAIPVLIGLLASILGISGLADKVVAVIHKIRERINKGITKFWTFVKEKGKALIKTVGSKLGFGKPNSASDKRTPAEKEKDLRAGVKEATTYVKAHKTGKRKDIDKKLGTIRKAHQLVELKLVTDRHLETGKDIVHVYGKVNPDLKDETVEVDLDNTGLEQTNVQHPGGGLSFADPLTSNRKSGTRPGDIAGWNHAALLNKSHAVWVRGHMVSQAFGGKGTEENLSIINKTANKDMETGPEAHAKRETDAGKTLKYETTWENYPKKGDIENFARKIDVKITDKKTNKISKFQIKPLPEPAETVDGIKFNLNAEGRPTLMSQFGLSETFARELIDERKKGDFRSISDIERRMEKYYSDKGYPKNNAKFVTIYEQTNILRQKSKLSTIEIK